jgi:hypothetical protein
MEHLAYFRRGHLHYTASPALSSMQMHQAKWCHEDGDD